MAAATRNPAAKPVRVCLNLVFLATMTLLGEVHAAEERLEAGVGAQPPLFLGLGTTGK
jgi:hypothetical protein